MKQDNLDLIRQKCIAANPEWKDLIIVDGRDEIASYIRPIRFADVLLVIGRKERGHLFARSDGYTAVFFKWSGFAAGKCHAVEPTYIEWNLCKDDLNEQSEETINFLADLLR